MPRAAALPSLASVRDAESKPLSSSQLQRLYNAPIYTVADLTAHPDEVAAALAKHKAVFLFIAENADGDMGHWTCMYQDGHGQLVYFDSFGFSPDTFARKFVPSDVNAINGQDGHPIRDFLDSVAPGNWRYNTVKLQQDSNAACGRWCALRLRFKGMCDSCFVKMLQGKAGSGLSNDVLTALTMAKPWDRT